MKGFVKFSLATLLSAGLLVGCATDGDGAASAKAAAGKSVAGGKKPTASAKDDADHENDYRTFMVDGHVKYGQIGDSYSADLVMYLDGNQFMVMEELIQDFQKSNPEIKSVYVETIPSGQILSSQILQQGEVDGEKINQAPDLYASVNLKHLQALAEKKLMTDYLIYARNKLELMVAKGNPKGVKGAEDLARDDLVQCHSNPLSEGIFKFFGAEMLKDVGIYEKVTGGKECTECWAVDGKTWFTSRHYRETPHRIENGEADVGIVWSTEVVQAKAEGRPVEGVSIAAPLNKQDKVGYAIGVLSQAKNSANAKRYLEYLTSDRAQSIYEKYGFIRATNEEMLIKPL